MSALSDSETAENGGPHEKVRLNNLIPKNIMAVRKIAMVVNLRQNKNQTSQGFGKWYPEVDEKKPLDLKGFCAQTPKVMRIKTNMMENLFIAVCLIICSFRVFESPVFRTPP